MRLLVISDSHKKSAVVDRVIRKEKSAAHIFFLGDVTDDIEDLLYEYTDRKFHIVRGNCDGFCRYPDYDIVNIEGVDILYTHGHTFGVKSSNDKLYDFAKNTGAKIALYGHTHISNIEYKDGIYLINPGSVSSPKDSFASYCVIDIDANGILPAIKKCGD
ncbi:MAG: metallophosphoesterase [Clostridia bacterium]|nr:metallophosphoesterase [Clostridia bacterium]